MAMPKEILAAPYRLGGRSADGIDCLGVVLIVSSRLGRPIPDPWPALLDEWRCTGTCHPDRHGFADGWQRRHYESAKDLVRDMADGDVWLWSAGVPGCGIVERGRIWTATPDAGVVCLDPRRATAPSEVWRR